MDYIAILLFLCRTSADSYPSLIAAHPFTTSVLASPLLFKHERILQLWLYSRLSLKAQEIRTLLQNSIVIVSCIFMKNYICMMTKNDLTKRQKRFSYHVVDLKGSVRAASQPSLLFNLEKKFRTVYNRQLASIGINLLLVISGSEFVLETSNMTSSKVQYSKMMNT